MTKKRLLHKNILKTFTKTVLFYAQRIIERCSHSSGFEITKQTLT